jgi:hypothetical protein
MLALRLPASPGGRRFLSVEANADHLVIAPGGVFLIDSKDLARRLVFARRDAVARQLPADRYLAELDVSVGLCRVALADCVGSY